MGATSIRSAALTRNLALRCGLGDLSFVMHARGPLEGVAVFVSAGAPGRQSAQDLAIARMLHGLGFGTLASARCAVVDNDDRGCCIAAPDSIALAQLTSLAAARLQADGRTRGSPIGYIAHGPDATAAILAATTHPADIATLVLRSPEIDYSLCDPGAVTAPTLLIVPSHEPRLVAEARRALDALNSTQKQLWLVPGATSTCDEPGVLDAVAVKIGAWFGASCRTSAVVRMRAS